MMILTYEDFLNENFIQKDLQYIQIFENYSDVMDQLEDSIQNKFVCTIFYKGENKSSILQGTRTIEPYSVGVNEFGNTIVRGWLIRGTSRTGKIDPSLVPGWRIFRIDRISTISQTLQNFTVPRKGYNRDDKKMTEVMFSASF